MVDGLCYFVVLDRFFFIGIDYISWIKATFTVLQLPGFRRKTNDVLNKKTSKYNQTYKLQMYKYYTIIYYE